jgi:hypothetical protein
VEVDILGGRQRASAGVSALLIRPGVVLSPDPHGIICRSL